MNNLKHLLYVAMALFIVFACGNKQETTVQESSLIEITNQQFTTDLMQLGVVELMVFERTVKCNGTLIPLPTGMAEVSAPISGVIKNIHCYNGQFVQRNQLLLEISGSELIDIQQEFAEASANHKRLKNDYERIRLLFHEKVSSEKEFIGVESEHKTTLAKYNGLKMKIEALGLSISKIENGEFYQSYSIKAPIKGHISSLNTNIGSYIDPQSELVKIIDTEMFQVKLSVFSTDIASLRKGQTVRFKPVNAIKQNLAIIRSIGVVVDDDSKSIQCFASIVDNITHNPIVNDFVESEIVTGEDTVKALPTEAILRTDTGHSVLVLEKQADNVYFFKRTDVTIGRQFNGYTEILDKNVQGKIITRGVYNISF